MAVASGFAQAGCDLIICARDGMELEAAADSIKTRMRSPSQRLCRMAADVSREEDVEALCGRAVAEFGQVHILVNNAGVYGPMGHLEDIDWEDWKASFAINVLGPAMMCRKMLPHFRRNHYGKIIQLSGGGATRPLPRLECYAASKSAVVRLAESIALDCVGDNVFVNAVAPGLLDTRMLDQVLEAGPEGVGEAFYSQMYVARHEKKATPVEVSVRLCLFLASPASDGITGKLISAVWDDYESWPAHIEELRGGDLYTLRRITGRDRQTGWGDK